MNFRLSSCPGYYLYRFCIYICMHCISVLRIFSTFFLNIFFYPHNATSINIHVSSSLFTIIMSGLLLGTVLLVC